MLCHFRFHSAGLSNEAAGLDFKGRYLYGENKNKYLFCGLLCFNMAARRDANWMQRGVKQPAAEIKARDLCLPRRKICDYCSVWLFEF